VRRRRYGQEDFPRPSEDIAALDILSCRASRGVAVSRRRQLGIDVIDEGGDARRAAMIGGSRIRRKEEHDLPRLGEDPPSDGGPRRRGESRDGK